MKAYHPFVSVKAKERYLARYDARARQWPVQAQDRMVETEQGRTFVRISGPLDAPPLILLPSASAPHLIWIPNVEALSAEFRVFALDNIYDFGRSVYAKPMKTGKDLLEWLRDLLDVLELDGRVHLVGLSFGAWIISQCLLHIPERLNRVVMCAPPATVKQLPASWAWHGITALIPHRYFMRNMMRWMMKDLLSQNNEVSRKLADDLIEDAYIGLRSFKLKMPPAPTVLTDEELASISTPALFLVGENEVLYPAEEVVARLNKQAPQIETEIIPDAGHDLTIVQAQLVNEKVIRFLNRSPE